MANGDLIKLGTLYLGGVKKARPTNPWRSGSTPGGGNIPVFSAGQTIEIRDTDADDAYKIQWREVNIGSKKLLIADRNILEQVSWDDLNAQNLIFGKNVTIDGQQYKLRVLTGGEERREGGTGISYEGGKLPNEWDDIIVNEGNYSGLPTPNSTDLGSGQNNSQRDGAHNQFWNWYYMYSWCQETYKHDGAHRAIRGYFSARYWNLNYVTNRYYYVGWRPVLEVLNYVPIIVLSSPDDNLTLSEGSAYLIEGTATDADVGDAVTVRYAINGGTARNITSGVSDGSTPIPFSKTLTFTGGRLYDGGVDVSGPLAENTTYTLSIWAVDDQGGTSTSYTRTFTVILNRPPTITLDPYNANQTNVSELETLTFAGTLTDPEGDTITLTVALNGGAPVTLKSAVASGTTFSYSVPVSLLQDGDNTIVFTATDSRGASATKTLTVNKAGTFTPVNTAVVRYAITPPLGTTSEIAAWVLRENGDLTVDGAVSIVGSADHESYAALTKTASVPLEDGTIEDEFVGTVAQPGAKVTLRLTLSRTNSDSQQAVKKIMGGIG